jgi:hypothetical protein
LAREEDGSMTANVGAPKFRAPEAISWTYTKACDVWGFGILIGEICNMPGIQVRVEQFDDKLDGVQANMMKDINAWKAESLANIKAREGGDTSASFLLDLAKHCLSLKASERPPFSKISGYFESYSRQNLDENFVKHIEVQTAEKLKSAVEYKVAERFRELYANMKVTSFEWTDDGEIEPESQKMACAAIDFAYIDLELERVNGKREEKIKKISLERIWDAGYQRIVAQGRPGAGKSTLLKWIAYKWAIGSLWQDFDIVVHIPLREYKEFNNLEQLLSNALGSGKTYKKMIHKLLEDSQAKILWLLDGWDEITMPVSGCLKRIQEGREPGVKWLIVGTRPERTCHFAESIKEATLEVCGFSQEGKQRYVSHYFVTNKDHAEQILELLKNNSILDAVCTLPLMLNLVCFSLPVLQSESSTNLKFSNIYTIAIEQLISRAVHLMERRQKANKKIDECLQSLAHVYFQNGTKITRKDLEEKDALKVGIIHSIGNNIYWNHTSFAEYFNAKYCHANQVPHKEFGLGQFFYCCFCNADAPDEASYVSLLVQLNQTNISVPIIQLCCMEFGRPFWKKMLEMMTEEKTMLIWKACLKTNNLELCSLFYDKCPDFCKTQQAFVPAVREGNKSIIQFLSKKGADPNTGVYWAVLQRNNTLIQFLMYLGAGLKNCLFWAAKEGDESLIRFLVEDNDIGKDDLNNVLYWVAQKGNRAIMQFLINKGANPTNGMYWAAQKGDQSLIRFFETECSAEANVTWAVCSTC